MVSSCDDGDDVTPIVDLNKPTMTIDLASAITVAEGTEIPVTFNLSAPVGQDFSVFVVLLPGSTADNLDSDIENPYPNTAFQKAITIPAFTTSFTTTIVINEDDAIEGVEHLLLSVGDTRTTAVLFEPTILDVTITNVVSDVLNLVLNFDKSFTSSGTTYTLCDIGYDMDFYVLDSTFTDMGIYGAATGNCPEELDLDITTLADGTYYIFYDIYDDAGLAGAPHTPFAVPITVDYVRSGGIAPGTFAQEAAFAPMSTDGSGSDYVITIEIANGVVTLKNSVPEVIASGRTANKVKAAIEKAKLNLKK
ncbi:hypothetical protein [Flavobacterium sp.]|uniref:hypothetical protein n=1 Tax=Flavobacterium sp. TaxID=239 RepID=UPI002B4B2B1F|nr:hypothetical protein [Flavobacterium sp.]HLF52765.1 hypothetical protein [Flavobacterium sp.]